MPMLPPATIAAQIASQLGLDAANTADWTAIITILQTMNKSMTIAVATTGTANGVLVGGATAPVVAVGASTLIT